MANTKKTLGESGSPRVAKGEGTGRGAEEHEHVSKGADWVRLLGEGEGGSGPPAFGSNAFAKAWVSKGRLPTLAAIA